MTKNKINIILFILPIIPIIVGIFLLYKIQTDWKNIFQEYNHVRYSLEKTKNDIVLGHLWLEEALGGDKSINFNKKILTLFSSNDFNQFLLKIKEDSEYSFIQNDLAKIDKCIKDIRILVVQRWQNKQTQGIGSQYDVKFDEKFSKLIGLIDKTIKNLEKNVETKIHYRKTIFEYAILLFSLIGVIIVTILIKLVSYKEKLQNKLLETQSRYKRLIENIKHHYFFFTHDRNGVFTYVNNAINEILGYDTREFLSHYKKHMTKDSINDNVDEYTKKALEGIRQKPYTISVYHKNGNIVYLEISETPVKDEYGKVICIEGVARDITEYWNNQKKLEHKNEVMKYKATHDNLTNLYNRVRIEQTLDEVMGNYKRYKRIFSIILIDIDFFKKINDNFGHQAGDQVLIHFAEILEKYSRETDIVGRWGGEEFIIICKETNEKGAYKLSENIRRIIENKDFNIDKTITASFGIREIKDDDTHESIIKKADEALYKSKHNGRNQTTVSS